CTRGDRYYFDYW
nr:immunoglobulin heavy chain junction region [Mus musculus]